MKFEELYQALGDQPYFDYAAVRLFFQAEEKASIRTSLYRFVKDGRLLSLRREVYAFAAPYAKHDLHGVFVANILYFPSYLSELWALSWYGVIPEKVVTYTSVAARPTAFFKNAWGDFRYRTLKKEFFFGYSSQEIDGFQVLVASPEKALLDYWCLEKGEWGIERLESMRFNPEPVDAGKLAAAAARFSSKQLDRAVLNWQTYAGKQSEGDIFL